MLERARRKSSAVEWVSGDLLALPFDDGAFDAVTIGFGVRNLADDLEPGLRELRRVLRPGGRLAILEITQPRGVLKPFFTLWFDRVVPVVGAASCRAATPTRYLPASVRRFPPRRGARRRCMCGRRVHGRPLPPARRLDRRSTRGRADRDAARRRRDAGPRPLHGGARAAARAGDRAPPGPRRGGRRGRARRRRQAAAAAPLLPRLARAATAPPLAAGVAVELIHMATLVHDDLVDGARMRRGAPAAWSVFGAGAALSAGDYLFACAFGELAETGDSDAVAHARRRLPRARPRRGDAAQPDARPRDARSTRTSSAARSRRGSCSRPRACSARAATRRSASSASRSGSRSRSPTTSSTARARRRRPGRSRAPTCARARRRCRCSSPPQEDEIVRAALAGGPLDGALVRVGATDALARSRDAALEYASRARSFLGAHPHREELEALTHAVVDRAS